MSHRTSMNPMGRMLLKHVLETECDDPDCEVHYIEAAMEEEVCSLGDVAYYLAGMNRLETVVRNALPQDESCDAVRQVMREFCLEYIRMAQEML